MKLKKILPSVVIIVVLMLTLTGCSLNQQEILNGILKIQDVNSMQEHTTLTFNISGSEFDPEMQKQLDSAMMFLNNSTLDFDVKTNSNNEKTESQSQVTMNLTSNGMSINVPVWVESVITGDTPKFKEIIKLPLIAKSTLPQEFANKDYMIMDLDNNLNLNSFTELNKFRKEEIDFLTGYAKRFNPNFDTVRASTEFMNTDDGFNQVRSYEIKLSDKQFKDFIRYTVNHFVQDKEAMTFAKDYLDLVLQLSQTTDQQKNRNDLDQIFKGMDSEQQRTQFLNQFNAFMDQMNDVTILGDKGIDITYYLSNGYLIKEEGTLNLKADLAQINNIAQNINGKDSSAENLKGTADVIINFDTKFTGINKPLTIKMPEVNSDNSFNYLDMMKSQDSKIKK